MCHAIKWVVKVVRVGYQFSPGSSWTSKYFPLRDVVEFSGSVRCFVGEDEPQEPQCQPVKEMEFVAIGRRDMDCNSHSGATDGYLLLTSHNQDFTEVNPLRVPNCRRSTTPTSSTGWPRYRTSQQTRTFCEDVKTTLQVRILHTPFDIRGMRRINRSIAPRK